MELFGKHREHLGTPRINLEKLLNKNYPSKRAKEDHGIFLANVTRSMWSFKMFLVKYEVSQRAPFYTSKHY